MDRSSHYMFQPPPRDAGAAEGEGVPTATRVTAAILNSNIGGKQVRFPEFDRAAVSVAFADRLITKCLEHKIRI